MSQEELIKQLELEASYRERASRSIADYMENLKILKKLQETQNRNIKLQIKLEAQSNAASLAGDQVAYDLAEAKLKILKSQTEEINNQATAMGNALASVDKKSLMGAKVLADSAKMLGKSFMALPGIVNGVYGKIKGLGLFEVDKAMKKSALSMGVLTKQSGGFRNNIKLASWETNKIGIGIEAVSKLQSDYSEELGRSVQLNQDSLLAMSEIGAATSLGVDGAARMTAELDRQGLSVMATRDFVQQTMDDSHAMGVNASKVMKNASNNIKLLNRYNFRDGIKGLGKMAQLVTKLGVGMEFAAGFADKLWNVEGAVDLSAQLQVMGGEFAKMADPFHLMYMARNDMEGLTKEIANAASASAKFNKNGEIEMGAKEMHRLKIIAEQTGIAYDDLVTAGKNSFKLKEFGKQVFSGATPEQMEFLANMAEMRNGKATIMIKGEPRLISQMDNATTKALMLEKESLNERAKNSRNFDDALTNTVNGLKTTLLPILEAINRVLLPKLDNFVKRIETGGWINRIEEVAKTIGSVISTIGGFIIDNPIPSALVYFGTKTIPLLTSVLGGMWDLAKWMKNGVQLGLGFNSVASTGGGGSGLGGAGRVGNLRNASKYGKFAKGIGGASAGLLSAGVSGYSEWNENSEKGMSTSENTGRTATRAGLSGAGAWGGAAMGATIGTLVLPGVGTAIGGLLGGIVGGLGGDKLGDIGGDVIYGKSTNDGIFSSPINDGVVGATKKPNLGPNFTKERGIIQGGKITPIDNKDDLLAMKPGGTIDKHSKNKTVTTIKHTFEDINISGEIKLTIPGNPRLSIDITKDPQFIREITKTIQSQIEKNVNGGKNRG